MDNASAHLTSFVKFKIIQMGIKVHFNVPYTPQFNCIEHSFGFIKEIIRKKVPHN